MGGVPPSRVLSGFMLFGAEGRPKIMAEKKDQIKKVQDVGKFIADAWAAADQATKDRHNAQSAKDREAMLKKKAEWEKSENFQKYKDGAKKLKEEFLEFKKKKASAPKRKKKKKKTTKKKPAKKAGTKGKKKKDDSDDDDDDSDDDDEDEKPKAKAKAKAPVKKEIKKEKKDK